MNYDPLYDADDDDEFPFFGQDVFPEPEDEEEEETPEKWDTELERLYKDDEYIKALGPEEVLRRRDLETMSAIELRNRSHRKLEHLMYDDEEGYRKPKKADAVEPALPKSRPIPRRRMVQKVSAEVKAAAPKQEVSAEVKETAPKQEISAEVVSKAAIPASSKPKRQRRYLSIDEIYTEYLPISKKRLRIFVKKYLKYILIGTRFFVERESLEALLSDPKNRVYPLLDEEEKDCD